ncbi:MAG: 23S rRNA (adenine(2503)-C(2))-methyltransferase RlmN [Clostridia bacterium]|nr:23S rRNA (adenine(2503)-C(2))-methyltransferase RlmN [Clostridia bacterium]
MIDLKSMLPKDIEEYLVNIGEKPFRAKQIFRWISAGETDIDNMTDLSVSLREKLKGECTVTRAKIVSKLVSKIDGTVKYLFELSDGEKIETVFMRYKYGNTVCISTQAGCRMGCTFCASHINGFRRHLTPGEMLEQVMAAMRDTGEKVKGIVLMGIGEPLDNYDNVLQFLRLVHHPEGLNISHRHISLSTCGLVDKIDMLAKEKLQITLSVSLHAPNDDIRRQTMPVARKFAYETLIDACKRYIDVTNRRISFEYALISGVNDSEKDAHQLGKVLSGMLCHVNLIPVNEVKERGYKKSTREQVARFTEILNSYKINTTVRRKLGGDINASCGQLRAEHREE